jgi:hypothetical protein
MEQTYFLARKRAELSAAQTASTSRERLIHYDLAGRYSVRAANAANINPDAMAKEPETSTPGG